MAFYTVKNSYLCTIIWNNNCTTNQSKVDTIIENIKNANSFSENQLELVRVKITNNFLPLYNKKWQKSFRKKNVL